MLCSTLIESWSNISVMFMFYLALTYMKTQLFQTAMRRPYSQLTFRYPWRSHLFPIIILGTFYIPCSSSCEIQLLTSQNDLRSLMAQVTMMPDAPLKQVYVKFLKRSWPAVSHTCSLSFFFWLFFLEGTEMILNLKSTPMVGVWVMLYFSQTNRRRMLVLPTAELPMMTILARQSYYFQLKADCRSFYSIFDLTQVIIYSTAGFLIICLGYTKISLEVALNQIKLLERMTSNYLSQARHQQSLDYFKSWLYALEIKSGGFQSSWRSLFSAWQIILRLQMQEIDRFEIRLKEATQLMSKGQVKLAQLQFKHLEKDVRAFFQRQKIEENDKLSEIQIAIYNNLACIFQKRGKYKSSLYHLSLAQKLENAYITHKYNDISIPVIALEKLATTYSNLSAVHSKLGNTNEALEDIQFAIEIMKRNQSLSNHQSFVFLYYNYSVLLQGANRFLDASRHALEGMRIATLLNEGAMKEKYEELLQGLRSQLKRQEERKQRQIKKYLKAEIGVYKPLKQLHLSFQQLSKYEPIEQQSKVIFKTLTKKRQSSEDFPIYTHQKLSFYRPRIQTQISNRRPKQSTSVGILQTGVRAKIQNKRISETNHTNRPRNFMNQTTQGIMEAYKFEDKLGSGQKGKKQFSTLCRETIDRRMRQKRNKLELQIGELGQKNEVLQRVIEKQYMVQQKKEVGMKNAPSEL